MIIQIIQTDMTAYYGLPDTVGRPVKVRFLGLSDNGEVIPFVLSEEGDFVPAKSLKNFLYLV